MHRPKAVQVFYEKNELMRLIHTTAFALAAAGFAGQASAGLILTGIIDGDRPGGLPKAIELYSDGITDLSTYTIANFNNGGTSVTNSTALSGTAADGEFIYVASETPQFTAFFGFAPDFTASAVNVNGDDVVRVSSGGVVIDTYGVIGTDGTGELWEYSDGFAYRKSNTGPDGSFAISNWDISENAADGELTAAGAGFPTGTFVIPEPASLALVALGGVALLGRRRSA